MKIAILSTSDHIGGAAIAASRLAGALTSLGHEVSMVTLDGRGRFPFLAERIGIFASNGLSRTNLFRVSTASYGSDVSSMPEVCDADVIMLGWFCQGLLSLSGLRKLGRLGKPIVWTMHDMWAFTGICHYSLGCTRYTGECGHCPFLRKIMQSDTDLSHRVWKRKMDVYNEVPIHFVSVSHWLADKAMSSSLLKGRNVTMIQNPHPIDDFIPERGHENLIVMGAHRLDDPIKGLEHAITALNLVYEEVPDAKAAFFGRIKNSHILSRLKMPYTLEGTLGPEALRALYSRASVVLSAADYETSGNTLIEGMASGAVPVSFDQGGQTEIIDHLTTGYLAHHPDTNDLARGIRWALKADIPPQTLHMAAKNRFGAEVVALNYLKLIENL